MVGRSPLKPLGVVKQKEILRLLANTLESARLTHANFGHIGTSGPFPTQEKQVTEFIRERTRLCRESWIIARLEKITELIKQNARNTAGANLL